jgi:hypothetical protein
LLGCTRLPFLNFSRVKLYARSPKAHNSAGGQRLVVLAHEWTFTYKDRSGWLAVQVSADDVRQTNARGSAPPDIMDYSPIHSWNVDSDDALRLAESYGGHLEHGPMSGGPGLFELRMRNVDGHTVPVWWVPHRLDWSPLSIRADTGAPVFVKDEQRELYTGSPPHNLQLNFQASQVAGLSSFDAESSQRNRAIQAGQVEPTSDRGAPVNYTEREISEKPTGLTKGTKVFFGAV